jgi:anti-anti-sigma factor
MSSGSSDWYVYTGAGRPLSLEIVAPEEGPAALVRVRGDLKVPRSGELEEAVNQLLDAAPKRPVILGMGDCSYVDGSGFGVLLNLSRRTSSEGGALFIAECDDRALNVAGPVLKARFFPSLLEALEAAVEFEQQHPPA